MKKYLWIGSFTDEATYKLIKKKGYSNFSQHLAQKNILEEIEKQKNIVFDSIGVVNIPENKDNYNVERVEFSHSADAFDCLVGYRNMIYLNKMYGALSLKKELAEWVKTNYTEDDELVVYVYEMKFACMEAIKWLKKRCRCKIVLIIPDLPLFMSGKYTFIKGALKRIEYRTMKRKLKYADAYVLFAENMAKYLNLKKHNWIVMEGTYKIDREDEFISDEEDGKFRILYTGIIDESYGLLKLADAVQELGEDYFLTITGSGISESLIRDYTRKKTNVEYLGFLENYDDVVKLQKRSSMLVNMRDPSLKNANYCFPSKLFEYMATGRLVLSPKLGGIPKEYYDFLITVDDIDTETLVNAIKKAKALTQDERKVIGAAAKDFIKHYKNREYQIKKVIEFTDQIA